MQWPDIVPKTEQLGPHHDLVDWHHDRYDAGNPVDSTSRCRSDEPFNSCCHADGSIEIKKEGL